LAAFGASFVTSLEKLDFFPTTRCASRSLWQSEPLRIKIKRFNWSITKPRGRDSRIRTPCNIEDAWSRQPSGAHQLRKQNPYARAKLCGSESLDLYIEIAAYAAAA